MGNEIPTAVRLTVHTRDQHRCLRCGMRATQQCHRRTRSVRDGHTHCPCNLWDGCHTCHQIWQHQHPTKALEAGFAVSRYEAAPFSVPINSWYGRILLLCNGDFAHVEE